MMQPFEGVQRRRDYDSGYYNFCGGGGGGGGGGGFEVALVIVIKQ